MKSQPPLSATPAKCPCAYIHVLDSITHKQKGWRMYLPFEAPLPVAVSSCRPFPPPSHFTLSPHPPLDLPATHAPHTVMGGYPLPITASVLA